MTVTLRPASGARSVLRGANAAVLVGLAILLTLTLIALLAPLLPQNPNDLAIVDRLKPPSQGHWFGTDSFGRDIFARTLWGARVSLLVGMTVAGLTILLGLVIGGLCGFFPLVDAILMRLLEGIMAIPGVLLAIAVIAITGPSLVTVIIAITVPEVPNMARLVRGIVLSVKRRPWVDAAIVSACPPLTLVRWHLAPSALPIVLVQAAYVCASAILTEAVLSFLGAGSPPDVPSWGGIIAQGKTLVQIAPWTIFFPSLFLTITVLSVNLLGDGLRDMIDPRLARDD